MATNVGDTSIQTVNLDVVQSDTYLATLTFTDSTGAAVNVSAWVFESQIRALYDSSAIITSFSFSQTGLATNQIAMSLTPAQTALLPIAASSQAGEVNINILSYDLKATLADGVSIYTIQQGAINVNPSVTK